MLHGRRDQFARLRRSNFNQSVWNRAREAVGLPNLHIHDLRHTGATLSAVTGATLKELMTRLGHSSPRAALIYQHASRDRDREVAKALGVFVQRARGTSDKPATDAERRERSA
jgi:integrase